jgi:hypothetical protein
MKIKILGTCTYSISIQTFIHTNIQQNKRLLTQKLWEELAGQMTNPVHVMYVALLSNKRQNYTKKGQNGMKFYHSLEILTNKLQNKFQLDMWKKLK